MKKLTNTTLLVAALALLSGCSTTIANEPLVEAPKIDPIVKAVPKPIPDSAVIITHNEVRNIYIVRTKDIDGVLLGSVVKGTKEPTLKAKIQLIAVLACIPWPVEVSPEPAITGKLEAIDTLGNIHDVVKLKPSNLDCVKGDGVNRGGVGIYLTAQYLVDNIEGFEIVIPVGDNSELIKAHAVQITSLIQGIQLVIERGTPKNPKGILI